MKLSQRQYDRLEVLRDEIYVQGQVKQSPELYVMYDTLRLLLEAVAEGHPGLALSEGPAEEAVESDA